MEKKSCLDDSNYSSPMPVIGLYITAATLVCLLFILLDIFSGFRNRKRWFTCSYFSLNSVTLTLLAVAAKLPVDLTTSMPRVEDQLSKLTGTTLICTCMSFLMPSLGTNSDSESLTNMAALSIFAITVVVNICIQMRTGVIILFRVQHIIILCCMMILLTALWYTHFEIRNQKVISVDAIKDHLTKGITHTKSYNMLHRLKLCYLCGYDSNPQLMVCKKFESDLVCFFSLLCSVVLAKVVLESLLKNPKTLEFCDGISSSDYGWSMRSIVISQIITIFVGCLGTTIRLLTMAGYMKLNDTKVQREKDAEFIILKNPIMEVTGRDTLAGCGKTITTAVLLLLSIFIIIPYICVVKVMYMIRKKVIMTNRDDDEDIKKYKDLIQKGDQMGLMDEWSLKKGVEDMKRWIELNKKKTKTSMNDVVKLLSKTPPSQDQSLTCDPLKNKYDSLKPGYTISCLSIVILEKIASISIPSSLRTRSLLSSSLKEVFKVIQFVDTKMSSASSFEKKKISKLSESLWQSRKFNRLLPKIVKKSGNDEIMFQSLSELDRAIAIIGGLKEALPSDFVWDELGIIVDFILQQGPYRSIEELYGYIEQLFVDMLKEFLIQLPNSIYKEIVESPAEEFEERGKFAVKLLCEIEQLEGLVQWSLPAGSGITSFITDDEVSNTSGSNVSNEDVRGDHAISMP